MDPHPQGVGSEGIGMGRTENFNLSTLGRGDSFDADGYKYTNEDRIVIDRLIRQAMEHTHDGATGAEADPSVPPDLTLGTSGGGIPAGVRLYYKYSLMDTNGSETAASPLAYIDTPNPVREPSAPTFTTASTGGILLPGTYYYVLTAYTTVSTLETMASKPNYTLLASATTTNTVTLTMPSLPSGATGFNIYRKGPGSPRYYYLASTTGTSYVDDGSDELTLSRTIPNTNRTFSANKVTITYPGATPAIPEGYTWKIYRSYDQSNWANSTLHHVVEETSVGSGVIVTEYEDLGEATSGGTPPEVSTFGFSPSKITLTDAQEIEGSPPPGLLTIPHQIAFGQPGVVVEENGILQWVCEFEEAEVVHVRAMLGRDSTAVNDITFDVEKWDDGLSSWDSIFDPGDRPVIPLGGSSSGTVLPTTTTRLVRGDALVVNVAEANEDVATPTALGFTFTVYLMVKSGSVTTSWDWT